MHRKCITKHVEEILMVGRRVQKNEAYNNKSNHVEIRKLNDNVNKLKK